MIRVTVAALSALVLSAPALGDDAVLAQVEPTAAPDAPLYPAALLTTLPEASPLIVSAAGYALFHDDVVSLRDDAFMSAADLDGALERAASHQPADLAKAWLAYASLLARESSAFADSVRETADYWGHDEAVNGILNDPTYAPQLEGGLEARNAIIRGAQHDASRVHTAGSMVKDRAYSLQQTPWAQETTGDNSERVANLDAVMPRGASPTLVARLSQPGGVFRFGPAAAQASSFHVSAYQLAENPRFADALDQAISLAALSVLEATPTEDEATLEALLSESDTQACLRTARLNLNMCIAATRYRYEDPFCIAEHALREVGDCIASIAGR